MARMDRRRNDYITCNVAPDYYFKAYSRIVNPLLITTKVKVKSQNLNMIKYALIENY